MTAPAHALRRLPQAEQLARRDESVREIATLLADGDLSAADIAQHFDLNQSTVYGRLQHMEAQGLAHRTGERDAHGYGLWAAGEAPVLEVCRIKTVPARQLGMRRDPLVAALFGPAQQ